MGYLAVVAATVASYVAGWWLGAPAVVPILNAAAGLPFMVASLRRRALRPTIARMLLWALTMAACATLLSFLDPWRAGHVFVRGAAYRDEMFRWVLTGIGAESTPSRFIPTQLTQAMLFALIALLTGSVLAMPAGAVLVNQMSTYVGSLAAASRHPALTMILGWHPWAVVRVVCFVILGVTLSLPVLSRLAGASVNRAEAWRLSGWAALGLAFDILLKAAAAPAWQRLLIRVVGW